MKRFYSFFIFLITAVVCHAQGSFPIQFADKDGNIIPDGSVLTFCEKEDDGFGDIQIPTRLYVKNTTGNTLNCGASYEIQSISNGTFQTCFPANCERKRSAGKYKTTNGTISGGELKNMQTEWLPTSDGSCVVVVQLLTYSFNASSSKWVVDGYGPQITMNFSTDPSANIFNTSTDKQIESVVYYSLSGQIVGSPSRGLYVKRTLFDDGSTTTQKIFMDSKF